MFRSSSGHLSYLQYCEPIHSCPFMPCTRGMSDLGFNACYTTAPTSIHPLLWKFIESVCETSLASCVRNCMFLIKWWCMNKELKSQMIKKYFVYKQFFFQSHRELYLLFSISNELSRSGRIDITEIVCQASSVERPVIVSVLCCRCLPSYTLSIISFWDLSQILGTLYFFFQQKQLVQDFVIFMNVKFTLFKSQPQVMQSPYE